MLCEDALRRRAAAPDHELVATAVFTRPEIGTVGMSEAKALARGHTIDIYKTSFRPLKHTLSGRDERSMMKLVVDAKTDKVLGCHIFGPEAGEMVQLVAIALKMGATKAQFDATVSVHPTMAEELVTIRTKTATKSPPKRSDLTSAKRASARRTTLARFSSLRFAGRGAWLPSPAISEAGGRHPKPPRPRDRRPPGSLWRAR